MQAGKRIIKDGYEFEHLIPKNVGQTIFIKTGATLNDTLTLLPKAIELTYTQAEAMARHLNGASLEQTLKNIWNWSYHHFQYELDQKGKEQIRSFSRSFADRKIGIDCDDFSGMISSLLTCLRIKHIFRTAKYPPTKPDVPPRFQHIYVIVPTNTTNNASYYTLDAVVSAFNYEVPYLETIDVKMDLEFLNGVPTTGTTKNSSRITSTSIDAEDLMNGFDGSIEELDSIGELSGKKGTLKKAVQKVTQNVNTNKTVQKIKNSKAVQAVKKTVHVANRINPGAALLRAGILASLKLNVLNVAGRLRYAYLNPNSAQNKGFDMSKWQQLVSVNNRLEKLFYGAGGIAANYKKAILTGKGNSDKDVALAGLGSLQTDPYSYTEDHAISQIIGSDSYTSEMQDLEGLGEPATGAAIAAASTAISAIAGLLAAIGSLRKKNNTSKNSGNDSGTDTNTESTNEPTNQTPSENVTTNSENPNTQDQQPDVLPMKPINSVSNETSNEPSLIRTSSIQKGTDTNNQVESSQKSTSTSTEDSTHIEKQASSVESSSADATLVANTNGQSTKGFWDKLGEWIKKNKWGVLAGVGTLGVATWAIIAATKKKNKPTKNQTLSGLPKGQSKTSQHVKNKKKNTHKKNGTKKKFYFQKWR
jgi:hypothetical protein